MVLCINRFALAQLIASNIIRRASQSTEVLQQQNPLTIKLNKNSKGNYQPKLYDKSITLKYY